MNRKMSFSRKILYNNHIVMAFSLVAAVIFWFIVVINVSPDYKLTVRGVAVDIDESSSVLTTLGLHAVDSSTGTVSITVGGPRNVIGRLKSDDFSVTPNLGNISKAGSYELELSATLKNPDNRISIMKINPAYVTVKFDTLATKDLPIEIKVQDNSVPEGYLMQTASANPSQVTISGPSSDLAKVANAVTYVKIGGNKTSTNIIKSDIELVDSNGKQLNLPNVQMSTPQAQVTVPILKMAEVALDASFTNVPTGFDVNNIDYSIDPKTITVAGEENKIDSLSKISLGTIDFSQLGLKTVKAMSIPNLGVMNVENITTANVTVNLKNTAERQVSTSTFKILNQPKGYTVTNKTKQITGITLFGPSASITKVPEVDAIIDMSSVQSGTGQYEVPVSFDVPGMTGFWVTGQYHAVVEVRRQW